MSAQSTPTGAGGPGLSRIPTLNSVGRSGASSRLPSPPLSPALSSPSTPLGNSLPGPPHMSASGTWTAGMLNQARERLAAAAAGNSTPSPLPSAHTPPSGGPGSRSGLPRPETGGSLRSSLSGLARPPIPTGWTTGAAASPGAQASTPGPGPSGQALRTSSPGVWQSPSGAGAGAAASPGAGRSGGGAAPGGEASAGRSSIQVAVRIRPLCEKERQRGDRVAWAADGEGNVGPLDATTGAFTPKHRFDTVFGPGSDNRSVASALALPLVGPALGGVNGTIFAYGVTSSGKTHTMMGTDADPGIVPRVVRELFAQIAAASSSPSSPPAAADASPPQPPPNRSFSVRMSIMEIYNEVLNDLLDPSHANLKMREDARSGLVVVDGLLEQSVASAEQALELIRCGDHNRKVGATAFNEDSSRSHTLTRIIIESYTSSTTSQPLPAPSGGADTPTGTRLSAAGNGNGPSAGGAGAVGGVRRTVACLSLIDLAGSESARAVVSKGQRMEGSFINRSLLTLGTVIHKLAAGAPGHVPFRDSKLTRLLQPSLSGPGARVAVVCNVTPAAAQSDETSNTLKFAARAKLVQVTARTNEVLDDRTLLRRYQKEVADLKRQLVELRAALAGAGVSGPAAAGGPDAPSLDGAVRASAVVDEAAVAALEAERDARRNAEMESTMLRIKLARLQAFLEERGVNVDDVFLGSSAGTVVAAAEAATAAAGEGSVSLRGPASPSAAAWPALAHGRSHSLRHASSASRLPTSEDTLAEAAPAEAEAIATAASADAAALSALQVRNSLQAEGFAEDAADGAPAAAAAAAACAPQATALSPDTADLRARVAAALAASDGGGCGDSLAGSASDVELDEDLNEGLMAQIRDMISEAQLTSSPSPRMPHDGATGGASAAGPSRLRHETGSDAGSAGEARRSRSGIPSLNAAPRSRPGASPTAAPPARSAPAAAAADGSPIGGAALRPGSSGVYGGTGGGGGTGTGTGGGPASASSWPRCSMTLSSSSSYGGGMDQELELQVMLADREVLHDQLVAAEEANEQLTAQVADLRRQLVTYEQLTRQAAGELAEIRRLKEAFQSRLQRENDELRAQLLAMGGTPPPAPAARTSPRSPPSPGQPQPQVRGGQVVGGGSGSVAAAAPVLGPAAHETVVAAAASVAAAFSTPTRSVALAQPHRYGVQSMAAFGSPAPVSYAASPAGPAARGGGGLGVGPGAGAGVAATPTRPTAPAPGVPRVSHAAAGLNVADAEREGAERWARSPSLHAMPSFGASFGTTGRPATLAPTEPARSRGV